VNLPARLGIDTNCFIYLLEQGGTARAAYMATAVLSDPAREAVTSTLTLAELLVKRYQVGPPSAVDEARAALEALPGLAIVPVDSDVAQEAARIRARSGFLLPDAIQLATAVVHEADAFLTNDSRLNHPGAGIRVLILDDLIG